MGMGMSSLYSIWNLLMHIARETTIVLKNDFCAAI